MLSELNDNELLSLAEDNNEEAEKILIEKYSNTIKKSISANLSWAKLSGLDEKDLYQEGLLALIYAIRNFSKERNVTFYTYALLCVDTYIRSAIRSANRYKFKALNESISLDKLFESSDINLYDILKDEASDPSVKLINKESNENLLNNLNARLAPFEKQVLNLKLEGLSNNEISIMLDKYKRSVENTISRIRTKYKEVKNEYEEVK